MEPLGQRALGECEGSGGPCRTGSTLPPARRPSTKRPEDSSVFRFVSCPFFFMIFVLRGGVVFQVRHYAGSSRQPFNRIDVALGLVQDKAGGK